MGKRKGRVKADIEWLGLIREDTPIRYRWRSLISGNLPTLPQCGEEGVVLYGLRSLDVKR